MMHWRIAILVTVVALLLGCCVMAFLSIEVGVGVRTEYVPPPQTQDELLIDDRLEDKHPEFDPSLIVKQSSDCQINASKAVVRLDCRDIRPDTEAHLLELHATYAQAIKAADGRVLPSINLISGAAKQFDDGLYAAIDLACFKGELSKLTSAPDVIEAIFARLPEKSPARPFLAAALAFAERTAALRADETAAKQGAINAFESDIVQSKPIGFYDTPEMRKVWKFYRFLQKQFDDRDLKVCQDIADVLAADADLLAKYRAVNGLFGRLTNPRRCLSAEALIGKKGDVKSLAQKRGVRHAAVAVFPPSTSREFELFEELFPDGCPSGVNLMTTLVHAVRDGHVDLEPHADSGWYQYQVYALETLLLPGQGPEKDKLLLTARYKKRLVDAFKATITKHLETHSRDMSAAKASVAMPMLELRVEPCPSYYLRTARAYAFLQDFLTGTLGKEPLGILHGRSEEGVRSKSLNEELESIRKRFYGFYLIACEDIGMRPEPLKDEHVDTAAAVKVALQWIEGIRADPDLARDTRVSVPVYTDGNTTHLWATVGVRLVPLCASYARPPKVRYDTDSDKWHNAPDSHHDMEYLIPVDDFAELELAGNKSLTRAELRALCDKHKTRDAIVAAASSR